MNNPDNWQPPNIFTDYNQNIILNDIIEEIRETPCSFFGEYSKYLNFHKFTYNIYIEGGGRYYDDRDGEYVLARVNAINETLGQRIKKENFHITFEPAEFRKGENGEYLNRIFNYNYPDNANEGPISIDATKISVKSFRGYLSIQFGCYWGDYDAVNSLDELVKLFN